ncbi:MAG: BamA/TamA family outer membrane protein [Thermodesulfobacteriota bacterium]
MKEVGDKAAHIAEDIHMNLSSDFQWSPREKTHIVLIDNTDFANAFATVLPYNIMYIQVVPPMADMTIGEHDDWLRLVITHEYAHILTMDPVRGYSKVMRNIFGKPVPGFDLLSFLTFIIATPPNVLLPSWWLEGMATWAETEHTGRGRGRSTIYETILRMAVLEDNIPGVDQLNGEAPYWPDGRIPYILGLRLKKHIREKYGEESLGQLNTVHSGRFPYFLNGVPARLLGKNYVALYRKMIDDLRSEQLEKIALLQETPLTPFKTLNNDGEMLTNPTYSPDGNLLAMNRRDPHMHEAIVIVDKEGREKKIIRRRPSDHAVTWGSGGESVCYAQAEVNNGFNLYQDIYCYDLKKNRQRRVTKGLRAKAPDMSPDGRSVVFVKNERTTQKLALLKMDDEKQPVEIITDYEGVRISTPRWSRDGKSIVFSVKESQGRTSLQLYNLNRQSIEVLFKDDFNNLYPVWSPDNRFIIFTSDRTGVFNLFAYSLSERKTYQITHVLGGAFQPDISRDGKTIVFSSYYSRGFMIATMEYNPETWKEDAGPAIGPYWQASKRAAYDRPPSPYASPPSAYSSLRSLMPRFWLPTIGIDHEGVTLGLFTAGQDVLAYNTFILQASYGIESNKPYFDLLYYYDRHYPTLFFEGFIRPILYSDFFDKDDYYEKQQGFTVGVSLPLNYVESRYRLIFGYQLKDQKSLSELTDGKFDGIEIFEGRRDHLFLGLNFSNALRYPFSISREEGRNISLLYRNYSKGFGSDKESVEYIASYDEYMSLSFLGKSQRHSVLFLALKGAISGGERIKQQAFQLGGSSILDAEFPLRGFPSKFEIGKYIATTTVEYRSPIRYLFKGRNTKPFFFDRLHGALFMDAGNVWDDETVFRLSNVKVGVGGELRLDMVLGYKLYITPTIGIAHGLDDEGETDVYFTIHTEI